MFLQVDARGADAAAELGALDGVTRRAPSAEQKNGLTALEVDSDGRPRHPAELAAAVVNRGWGLLELRPMRMSLEDVFLHSDDAKPTRPRRAARRRTATEAA